MEGLTGPKTQSAQAIKALITYHNHNQEPQEMPDFYRLTGEMVLVRNNKGDAYYVVSPCGCSCPAATYHPGQLCKHSRKFFPQSMREAAPNGSIKPMFAEPFRPFAKLPGEEA